MRGGDRKSMISVARREQLVFVSADDVWLAAGTDSLIGIILWDLQSITTPQLAPAAIKKETLEAQQEAGKVSPVGGAVSGEQAGRVSSAVSGEQAGRVSSAVSGEQAGRVSSVVSGEQAGRVSPGIQSTVFEEGTGEVLPTERKEIIRPATSKQQILQPKTDIQVRRCPPQRPVLPTCNAPQQTEVQSNSGSISVPVQTLPKEAAVQAGSVHSLPAQTLPNDTVVRVSSTVPAQTFPEQVIFQDRPSITEPAQNLPEQRTTQGEPSGKESAQNLPQQTATQDVPGSTELAQQLFLQIATQGVPSNSEPVQNLPQQTAAQGVPSNTEPAQSPPLQTAGQAEPSYAKPAQSPPLQTAVQVKPSNAKPAQSPPLQTAVQAQPRYAKSAQSPPLQTAVQAQPSSTEPTQSQPLQTAVQAQPSSTKPAQSPPLQTAVQAEPSSTEPTQSPSLQTAVQAEPSSTEPTQDLSQQTITQADSSMIVSTDTISQETETVAVSHLIEAQSGMKSALSAHNVTEQGTMPHSKPALDEYVPSSSPSSPTTTEGTTPHSKPALDEYVPSSNPSSPTITEGTTPHSASQLMISAEENKNTDIECRTFATESAHESKDKCDSTNAVSSSKNDSCKFVSVALDCGSSSSKPSTDTDKARNAKLVPTHAHSSDICEPTSDLKSKCETSGSDIKSKCDASRCKNDYSNTSNSDPKSTEPYQPRNEDLISGSVLLNSHSGLAQTGNGCLPQGCTVDELRQLTNKLSVQGLHMKKAWLRDHEKESGQSTCEVQMSHSDTEGCVMPLDDSRQNINDGHELPIKAMPIAATIIKKTTRKVTVQDTTLMVHKQNSAVVLGNVIGSIIESQLTKSASLTHRTETVTATSLKQAFPEMDKLHRTKVPGHVTSASQQTIQQSTEIVKDIYQNSMICSKESPVKDKEGQSDTESVVSGMIKAPELDHSSEPDSVNKRALGIVCSKSLDPSSSSEDLQTRSTKQKIYKSHVSKKNEKVTASNVKKTIKDKKKTSKVVTKNKNDSETVTAPKIIQNNEKDSAITAKEISFKDNDTLDNDVSNSSKLSENLDAKTDAHPVKRKRGRPKKCENEKQTGKAGSHTKSTQEIGKFSTHLKQNIDSQKTSGTVSTVCSKKHNENPQSQLKPDKKVAKLSNSLKELQSDSEKSASSTISSKHKHRSKRKSSTEDSKHKAKNKGSSAPKAGGGNSKARSQSKEITVAAVDSNTEEERLAILTELKGKKRKLLENLESCEKGVAGNSQLSGSDKDGSLNSSKHKRQKSEHQPRKSNCVSKGCHLSGLAGSNSQCTPKSSSVITQKLGEGTKQGSPGEVSTSKPLVASQSSSGEVSTSKPLVASQSSSKEVSTSKPLSHSRSSSKEVSASKPLSRSRSSSKEVSTSKPVSRSRSSSKEVSPLKPLSASQGSSKEVSPSKPLRLSRSSSKEVSTSKTVSRSRSSSKEVSTSKSLSGSQGSSKEVSTSKPLSASQGSSKDDCQAQAAVKPADMQKPHTQPSQNQPKSTNMQKHHISQHKSKLESQHSQSLAKSSSQTSQSHRRSSTHTKSESHGQLGATKGTQTDRVFRLSRCSQTDSLEGITGLERNTMLSMLCLMKMTVKSGHPDWPGKAAHLINMTIEALQSDACSVDSDSIWHELMDKSSQLSHLLMLPAKKNLDNSDATQTILSSVQDNCKDLERTNPLNIPMDMDMLFTKETDRSPTREDTPLRFAQSVANIPIASGISGEDALLKHTQPSGSSTVEDSAPLKPVHPRHGDPRLQVRSLSADHRLPVDTIAGMGFSTLWLERSKMLLFKITT